MGDAITTSQFDYLFIQFYNNPCSAWQWFATEAEGWTAFNYDDWVTYTMGTASTNAQLFIGLPASPTAANQTDMCLMRGNLNALITEFSSHSRFGGVMLWDAYNSDLNIDSDGSTTYAQSVHASLNLS